MFFPVSQNTQLDVVSTLPALDVNVPVVAVVFTLVEEIVILLPFLSTEYPLMPKSKSDKTPLLSDNVVSNL